jgi:hypothetical protein
LIIKTLYFTSVATIRQLVEVLLEDLTLNRTSKGHKGPKWIKERNKGGKGYSPDHPYLNGAKGRSDNRKCRIILKTNEKDEGKYQLN